MTDQKGFRIEVSSRFEEFWRYNVAMTGGLFDARGERIGFASTEDTVAETERTCAASRKIIRATARSSSKRPPANGSGCSSI